MSKATEQSSRIDAHRITKPIQLLAAWLIGLTAVNASFLTAAAVLNEPAWLRAVLVLAAVMNVPMFLAAIFMLQTRFRPEMQEDTYYSKYLESKLTNKHQVESTEIDSIRAEIFDASTRTLGSVESLQSQVATLVSSLDLFTVSQGSKSNSEIKSLSRQIDKTRELLKEARKDITWTRYNLNLNDLLPSYEQVNNRLKEAGIAISDTFGSTSELPLTPGLFVLSFGSDVEAENLQELIRILSDAGLEALLYSNEKVHSRKIYLGSYGYHNESVAWLTSDFKNSILKPGMSSEEFVASTRASAKPVLGDLNAALASLTSQQAKAAMLHLGVDGAGPFPPNIIGSRLGLPATQVKRILEIALRKLDQKIVRPLR